MTRGAYTTPRVWPEDELSPLLSEREPRIFKFEIYGNTRSLRIRPDQFATVPLAGSLADKWLEVSREMPGSAADIRSAICSFLQSLGRQLHVLGSGPDFGLSSLRVRHLDRWEQELGEGTPSPFQYQQAVKFFVLLRRIDADSPKVFDDELKRRLEHPTRLIRERQAAGMPFSTSEVRKLRAAAHRCIHKARQVGPTESGPDKEQLIALNILLSLATGEPPEVLRRLQVSDVVVSQGKEIRGLQDPDDPAVDGGSLDSEDVIAVTYTKMRSHEVYEVVYGRKDKAAFDAFANILFLTQRLIETEQSEPLWRHRVDGVVTQARWHLKGWSLKRWFDSNGLTIAPPHRWDRLRKSATTREAIKNPSYLRDGRRHSAETFFRYYVEDPVLRADAGRKLMSSVDDKFTLAVNGPTVLSPGEEEELRQGGCLTNIDSVTAESLLSGELDGPHAACKDPEDSPFEKPGIVCSKAITGLCFACPNALITKDHLPAVIIFARVTDPDRSASPEQWLRHWKPVHDAITRRILPAFSSELIAAAEKELDSVLIDIGTLNDMRGPHGNSNR